MISQVFIDPECYRISSINCSFQSVSGFDFWEICFPRSKLIHAKMHVDNYPNDFLHAWMPTIAFKQKCIYKRTRSYHTFISLRCIHLLILAHLTSALPVPCLQFSRLRSGPTNGPLGNVERSNGAAVASRVDNHIHQYETTDTLKRKLRHWALHTFFGYVCFISNFNSDSRCVSTLQIPMLFSPLRNIHRAKNHSKRRGPTPCPSICWRSSSIACSCSCRSSAWCRSIVSAPVVSKATVVAAFWFISWIYLHPVTFLGSGIPN